jgi:CBS domain-containing protein
MEALVAAGVLKPEQMANLRAAFDFLVVMRLRGQIEALRAGRKPGNYISLARLNVMEQGELRLALQEVANFQSFIAQRFKLQLLRN